MIEATDEMIGVAMRAVPDMPAKDVRAVVRAVLNVLDPVSDDIKEITDGYARRWRRMTRSPMVWTDAHHNGMYATAYEIAKDHGGIVRVVKS